MLLLPSLSYEQITSPPFYESLGDLLFVLYLSMDKIYKVLSAFSSNNAMVSCTKICYNGIQPYYILVLTGR